MKLIKNMINYKVNIITADDLLRYANQFQINITRSQAEEIAAYLRGKNFDVFDDRVRSKLIKEVAMIAGPQTAKELNKLIILFTSS